MPEPQALPRVGQLHTRQWTGYGWGARTTQRPVAGSLEHRLGVRAVFTLVYPLIGCVNLEKLQKPDRFSRSSSVVWYAISLLVVVLGIERGMDGKF